MERLKTDLAKYTVHNSIETNVPYPGQFDQNWLVAVAMVNFKNTDKTISSGMMFWYNFWYDFK